MPQSNYKSIKNPYVKLKPRIDTGISRPSTANTMATKSTMGTKKRMSTITTYGDETKSKIEAMEKKKSINAMYNNYIRNKSPDVTIKATH